VPEPFYYLGLIAQEENEDERAKALLEKAIEVSPSFANAYVALGASLSKAQRYPRAQKELELGAKLNPDAFESALSVGGFVRATQGPETRAGRNGKSWRAEKRWSSHKKGKATLL